MFSYLRRLALSLFLYTIVSPGATQHQTPAVPVVSPRRAAVLRASHTTPAPSPLGSIDGPGVTGGAPPVPTVAPPRRARAVPVRAIAGASYAGKRDRSPCQPVRYPNGRDLCWSSDRRFWIIGNAVLCSGYIQDEWSNGAHKVESEIKL